MARNKNYQVVLFDGLVEEEPVHSIHIPVAQRSVIREQQVASHLRRFMCTDMNERRQHRKVGQNVASLASTTSRSPERAE